MTQFEQENDLGRGGGQVDDETLAEAWETRERLGSEGNLDEAGGEPGELEQPDPGEPWANASSGDADTP